MILGFATGVFPLGIVGVFCGALCCVLGLINFKKAVSEINWDVTIRLGGTLGLAKCLSDSGFVDWIGEVFIKLFGRDVNPWVFFIVVVILSLLLSQFVGNSATIVTIGTPVCAMALELGINPVPLVMGVTLAGSWAFCTYIAGACIGLSAAAGYKFTDYINYNWQPTVICLASIMLIPVFYPF